ncbi:hypothetical protein H8711_10195 [Clostridiaceae bacterium NSJ-31]|uniref:Uncharacterized protein n=1 Tax=Ligaoa zhengdingensis TaxID=2763658 RepID=A0A926I4D6_9FIRM|nr:DUF6179 domain-containing protein [Ligaoa zhengdingensis]MBC8547294.1 hypothetical protein [Ligaoa zhengdingensis]
MEALDILHPIKEEMLNSKYYFQSLIEQACYCGLLSEKELSAVQTDLLLILAEQTDKWSKGESSSIPTEKAQDIMTSILFVIGIQLKSYQTPEQAVDVLKSEPLKLLFENGLKLVRRKMAVSRHLQKRILDHLLDTPNVYYRSTVADGVNGFFKLYRPQFAAHEIHITADYPIFLGRPELEGIEFIEKYLRCIQAENAFCVCFAPQDIHHLLCGLTQDYRSVPLNIFEPVLLSALGLMIQERNPKRLDLTEHDISFLYRLFSGQSEKEVQSCLKKALFCLNEKIDLPQISIQYASLCIPKLTATILNAVKMETLDKVFLIPTYPEQEPQIILSYGDRMNDNAYQKLVERILQTDSSEEKIALILDEVHSLADLLDILSDTELYADEFDLLINRFPLPVFAMLLSQYPNDDFLDRKTY